MNQQLRGQTEQIANLQTRQQSNICVNQQQINTIDPNSLMGREYVYNNPQVGAQNYFQSEINKKEYNTINDGNKGVAYKPHVLTQIIMWLCVGFWCFLGLVILLEMSFIVGTIFIAGGLIMCPLIKRELKFWPKFAISFVFITIAIVLDIMLYG